METSSSLVKKVVRPIVAINTAGIVIAATVLALCAHRVFERKVVSTLSIQANVIGRVSMRPLLEGHQAEVEEYLSLLRTNPDIRIGTVYSPAGVPVAVYRSANLTSEPSALPSGINSEAHWFRNSRAVLVSPIWFEGKRLGYVYLRSSADVWYVPLELCAGLTGLLLLVAVVTNLLVSFVVDREVNQRAICLTAILRIALEGDYSVRASETQSWGELRGLKERLNEFIAHVEAQLAGRSRSDQAR